MKKVGSLIDALKTGQSINHRHHNPYLEEALGLTDILITQKQLIDEPNSVHSLCAQKNVIVEIGCYFGKTVVELAQLNPQHFILGVDITYKRVVKSARKIKNHKLNNARIALCNGSYLLQNSLQNESIQGLCIFFPDPWPKLRQQKNRLLNEDFARLAFEKIKPGGFVWIKTDQQSYFQDIDFHLLRCGFILLSQAPPPCLQLSTYETEFQKLFARQNIPFFEGVYIKRKESSQCI